MKILKIFFDRFGKKETKPTFEEHILHFDGELDQFLAFLLEGKEKCNDCNKYTSGRK